MFHRLHDFVWVVYMNSEINDYSIYELSLNNMGAATSACATYAGHSSHVCSLRLCLVMVDPLEDVKTRFLQRCMRFLLGWMGVLDDTILVD